MTLNDIIIRDLEACRREEEAEAARKAAEKAHRDYDRAILRRLWGRRLRVIGEALGGILVVLLFLILAWLYLVITPDQRSAECDYQYYLMEQGK